MSLFSQTSIVNDSFASINIKAFYNMEAPICILCKTKMCIVWTQYCFSIGDWWPKKACFDRKREQDIVNVTYWPCVSTLNPVNPRVTNFIVKITLNKPNFYSFCRFYVIFVQIFEKRQISPPCVKVTGDVWIYLKHCYCGMFWGTNPSIAHFCKLCEYCLV